MIAYARLGGCQQALEFCEQALALHRELADRPGDTVTLDSLGYAHHHLGHHREAIDVDGGAGDLDGMAEMLTHLGHAYQAAGNPHAARRAWQLNCPVRPTSP